MFASLDEEEREWHSAQVKRTRNSISSTRVPLFSLLLGEVGTLANVILALSLALILLAAEFGFAQSPKTIDAFDQYIASAEARVTQMRSAAGTFLAIDSLPSAQRQEIVARLRQGEVVIEKQGSAPNEIPGGLIHEWVGTVFIPKATVAQVLSLIQDTEYNVRYERLDAARQYSFSRSTRISEIVDLGTPAERTLAPGHDQGFMWRLNSYWAFEQVEDGVFVECEAISLPRDIPTGLGWVVGPFVQSIPRESLQFTLNSTRKALTGKPEAK